MTYFTRLIGSLRNTLRPASDAPDAPAPSGSTPGLVPGPGDTELPSAAEGPTAPVVASD